MRNLLEFLSRYVHWLLFVMLEAAGLWLLFSFNAYQGSVWFTSANAFVGKVYEWESEAESFFSLRDANEQLTRRNVELEEQVSLLQRQIAADKGEGARLDSTEAALLAGYRLVAAKVVSNSLDKPDNLITINKGEADGVRPDMGVVSGLGVVGIVYQTSRHYSIVIPVLNSKSNISCMIRGKGYFGYLHWNGGYRHMAYVDDIPRHARFSIGDEVVTSGYSSVFPPGMPVGKIRYVFNSPDGLSYRLKIQLATDFGNLRDVVVIDNAPLEQQLDILRAAEDSLRVKQN